MTSAASVNYTDDGDGKRVEKSSGTYYWFSPAGIPLAETDTSGNTQNEYIYFTGGRTARRDSSGNVYCYFSDQIGTSQLIFNATSGAVCYDSDSTPFGYQMVYTTGCAQEYEFAGMELDSETDNYATWFRNYYPNLGRWMSPDPLGGDITNPQSLNRYAYALNDPTTLTDPLGLYLPTPGPCDYNAYDVECGGGPGGGGGWGGGWGEAFGPYGLLCDDPEDPYSFCFTIYLPMPGPGIGGGGDGNGQFPPGTTPIPPGQGPVTPWPTPTGCFDATGEPAPCPWWWLAALPPGAAAATSFIGPQQQPPAQPSQVDTRPSCIGVFASSLFGQPVTEQALAQGTKVGSQAFATASLRYQMENLLVVPLRSVYVRGMNGIAEILGISAEASPYLFAAATVLPAAYTSAAANLTGACQNNFWSSIF